MASKPVMEGKAVLLKHFGGVDSFDVEVSGARGLRRPGRCRPLLEVLWPSTCFRPGPSGSDRVALLPVCGSPSLRLATLRRGWIPSCIAPLFRRDARTRRGHALSPSQALKHVYPLPSHQVDETDPEEFIKTVARIAGTFGGINLEDIKGASSGDSGLLSPRSRRRRPLTAHLFSCKPAPECFEIEERLKDMCDIPIFHDDQHGTGTGLDVLIVDICTASEGRAFPLERQAPSMSQRACFPQ